DTGTLQGDIYKGSENATRNFPVTSIISSSLVQAINDIDQVSGIDILVRWKHEFNKDSDITLQAYYDDSIRHFFDYGYDGTSFHTQTVDFDFQHDWIANQYNQVTWGLGYFSGIGFTLSIRQQAEAIVCTYPDLGSVENELMKMSLKTIQLALNKPVFQIVPLFPLPDHFFCAILL